MLAFAASATAGAPMESAPTREAVTTAATLLLFLLTQAVIRLLLPKEQIIAS
jgi:hypothetical protein